MADERATSRDLEIENYTLDDLIRIAEEDILRLDALKLQCIDSKRDLTNQIVRAKDNHYRGRTSISFLQLKALEEHVMALGALQQRIQLAQSMYWKEKTGEARRSDKRMFEHAKKERDEATELCRRLAAEIESLQSQLERVRAGNADSITASAFVDVARLVLAESTFNRIMERANERVRGKQAT